MRRIYLDYAAATPVDEEVLRAMLPYFSDEFHNPSALYKEARAARDALESARSLVARNIGTRPSEVIFTAGGTESDNLAIRGVMEKYPGKGLVISSVEHDAVHEPARTFNARQAPVGPEGITDIGALRDLIDDETVLISVMLVNSEIGAIQPVSQITALVRELRQQRRKRGIKLPLLVHTDACQAPLYLDINTTSLGVDLMTLNGGKMHGPKQSGILYVKAGVELTPQIRGGGQEFGFRSGTESVANAVGFAAALDSAVKGRAALSKSVQALRDELIELLTEKFGGQLNGSRKHRIANNVHVTFPGIDNERVLFALDDLGVSAAAGSACSASKDEPSRVLKSIGLTDDQARASLRFTLGRNTSKSDLAYLQKVLPEALKA